MAVVVGNIGSNGAGGGSVTVTVGAGGVPAGAKILAAMCCANNLASIGDGAITDTAGNTYTLIVKQARNNTNNQGFISLWQCEVANALVNGDTITYTLVAPNAGNKGLSLIYATGLIGVGGLDSAATATAFGNASSFPVTSGTPSEAGELFIAAATSLGGNSAVFTPDATWNTPFDQTTTGGVGAREVGGHLVNAGSSALTNTQTASAASNWAAAITAFKAAPDTGGLLMMF